MRLTVLQVTPSTSELVATIFGLLGASHPTNFQVELTPRSPHAVELIHRIVEVDPAHEFHL